MKLTFLGSTVALLTLAAFSGCSKPAAETTPVAAAETKHEENVVTLTKESLAHVTLKTEAVTRGSLDVTLKAVGRLGENLNKTAKVTSTFEGRLTKLNVDLNERVKAGDVMGLVQAPELFGKALELKAPIDGVVIERKSTAGELIGRDTEIYTISDPTDLWLLAEIKERDIGAIKVPALFIYSPADKIVDAGATEGVVARWGGPHLALQVPINGDPSNHILAGRIVSPKTTDEIAERIVAWIKALPAQ